MSTTQESYLIGLIGDGITASLTPPMHEAEAAAQGLHYLYRPVDLALIGRSGEDVGELMRAGRDLGFNAFNITHPCKQIVLEHLDEIPERAAALQAVNTVLIRDGKFIGENTDQSGFASALAAELPDAAKDKVVQLGTGGAGSAVAYALLDSGVQDLTLFDLDLDRAKERAAALAPHFPSARVGATDAAGLEPAVEQANGVVNCTPIGMHHHPGAPIDLELITAEHWVADVIYLPVDTPLVTRARELGCQVLDGGAMAVGQAVDAFRLITGVEPDRQRMRVHFLEMLADQQP
ncbi:shikimate dehydrogenase [Kocuria soli]|uniref:Shikimate dehydrogenase (NADP(+)) n=1 Tax=Kocuria soli TaxID=2485125 RepID=A0A3N3ZTN4_9MICC|nr:shikimate dehydrogenase [Kocuria soli]ROZ65677.1 shikimate dehydrogenase [Kocuria soli]